ncbi:hypothetical protein RRG08_028632 [Elysia crispata]|uniref:Uncharacterized protein n=1 Tax=Elysia crispata TaxID=231223 RepID=A0AAE0ZT20_9GAST|nr:hypothetical protein RRG08_028632 [Elysia crispata]
MVDLRLFFSPVPHYRETYFAANNNDGDVIGDRCREEAEVNSIETIESLLLTHNRGKKEDPTRPLCQGRQATEHVLNSYKIALSQGRYTWRHNRVLQELAANISTAKGETTLSKTNALIFTTEGGAKSWHGRATSRIKCLLDVCDDGCFSKPSRMGQSPQYNQRNKIKA